MTSPKTPPAPGGAQSFRLRPLKRGDKDAIFRLLAEDGWPVKGSEQETAISWVVQHPELDTIVAHDTAAYTRVLGAMTLSHRPQLRLGGRVASIDLFVVGAAHRHVGIGHELLAYAVRRADALGCKRVEVVLPEKRDERHTFFEAHGFREIATGLFVREGVPVKGTSV